LDLTVRLVIIMYQLCEKTFSGMTQIKTKHRGVCSQWNTTEERVCSVAYRGGGVARAALPKGRHFRENGKI